MNPPTATATAPAPGSRSAASIDLAKPADIEVASAIVLENPTAARARGICRTRIVAKVFGETHALRDLRDDPPVGLVSPGASINFRWREMRRSELGRCHPSTPGGRRQSHLRMHAGVGGAHHLRAIPAGTSRVPRARVSASGMLTTGLVAMIQIALIVPSSTARNMSTAFKPGRLAITGESQAAHALDIVRREIHSAASMSPCRRPRARPWHFGCRKRQRAPMPGRPMRPVSKGS